MFSIQGIVNVNNKRVHVNYWITLWHLFEHALSKARGVPCGFQGLAFQIVITLLAIHNSHGKKQKQCGKQNFSVTFVSSCCQQYQGQKGLQVILGQNFLLTLFYYFDRIYIILFVLLMMRLIEKFLSNVRMIENFLWQ